MRLFPTRLYLLFIKEVMMKPIFTLLALVAFAGNAVAEPQPNAPAAKPAAASKFVNKGKVLEVIDTSMYTYLQVTSDKGPVWLAASKTSIAKGANIGYPNGDVHLLASHQRQRPSLACCLQDQHCQGCQHRLSKRRGYEQLSQQIVEP